MAAEFFILFDDQKWHSAHLNEIEEKICSLTTFTARKSSEFWLLGSEGKGELGRYDYDMRIFTRTGRGMLMEISAHPASVESDIHLLLAWLRKQTQIAVVDEDGERSSW